MKHITLITTGQPTTNPRLVKEAETLKALGYQVKVIYCFYQAWAEKFDREITAREPGMYICCGGDPVQQKWLYFKTRLRQKLCTLLFKYLKKTWIAENAISRTHAEALVEAKKIRSAVYIAHNLGALPAAIRAAAYWQSKAGYDAEDMHSGQFSSTRNNLYQLNKYIEEKYFPQAAYFSAASPLIGRYYARLYPYLKPVVINNVFPKTKLVIRENYKKGGPLKLFWFSQTIGSDRGLELVIKAISQTGGFVQLHLLGHCAASDRQLLLGLAGKLGLRGDQLHFHKPIAAAELFTFAARFDIGLASETGSTLNRDICLTNKIFTYLQCGLAILASDTQAQQLFMQQYPASGQLYDKNNEAALTGLLKHYAENPALLYQTRLENYRLGQTALNWEAESRIFIQQIQHL
ncbi:hypothetical protein ACFGVS_00845 [Mucilaginibacter sp. AW1-7]|uniref:hypothetical protein n=1 Tax=Mucilaginibacter sp. AW1-7 TaxID=3349874 RepID=UPI003F738B4F